MHESSVIHGPWRSIPTLLRPCLLCTLVVIDEGRLTRFSLENGRGFLPEIVVVVVGEDVTTQGSDFVMVGTALLLWQCSHSDTATVWPTSLLCMKTPQLHRTRPETQEHGKSCASGFNVSPERLMLLIKPSPPGVGSPGRNKASCSGEHEPAVSAKWPLNLFVRHHYLSLDQHEDGRPPRPSFR